jgi:glycyl-tRNA synthetase
MQEIDCSVPESSREGLLEEVTNLVESPTVLRGEFEAEFLDLPEAVLIMVMRKHQRYFPVYDASGNLRNAFVAVINGSPDLDRVRAGNEDVLRARFRDAVFFYKADLRVPLEDFVPRLQGAVFHRDIGSVHDKVLRTAAIVPAVAVELGLEDAAADGKSAAVLGKADQATAMVTEMTALTGIMGKHYAEKQGLPQVCSTGTSSACTTRCCILLRLCLRWR